MGLSFAISAGIVMMVVFYVMLTIPGLVDDTISLSGAATEASQLEKSIANTDIDIPTISMTAGLDTLDFSLTSEGSQKLWNYEKFNVFVTYNGTTSGQVTDSLTYAGDCSGPPISGYWCKQSIVNDVLDPDILNEGEQMVINAKLNEIVAAGIGIVVLVTDIGVFSTISTLN